MAVSGYENLMSELDDVTDQHERKRQSSSDGGKGVRDAGRGCSNGGCYGTIGKSAAIATLLLVALGSAGLSGWSGYRFLLNKRLACKYAIFALDTDPMLQCGTPVHREEAPCRLNSTAYVTSRMYNNALGPWKMGESSKTWNGGDSCEMQLTRRGTHLIVAKTGLYQLSAQVTFDRQDTGSSAELVWQVNDEDWIAIDKGRSAVGGPTQAYLSAVRRLQAGQQVSLHLRQAQRTIGTESENTYFVLSML